jgi:CRISPR-associated protein Csy1
LQSIIDKIIETSWAIRLSEGGWSLKEYYSGLPAYQKIWLDAAMEEDRNNSVEWQEKVLQDIARWICVYPVKPEIQKGHILGDDEYRYIMTLLEESKEALQ